MGIPQSGINIPLKLMSWRYPDFRKYPHVTRKHILDMFGADQAVKCWLFHVVSFASDTCPVEHSVSD